MGKLGAIKDAFARGATTQQVEFAKALRKLHGIVAECGPSPLTLQAIGDQIHVSEQHISNFLHAERQPSENVVAALFDLAEATVLRAGAAGSAAVMPFDLEELQRLRELAIKPCKPCRAWHNAVIAEEVDGRLAARDSADTDKRSGVPVPHSAGDRHPRPEALPHWPAVGEVLKLSESGLVAELLTLLDHVGATTEPNEMPSIMHTLHSSGLDDAADAVANAAATRPTPVVLEIALKLHDSGLSDALDRFLPAAHAASLR